MAYLIGFLSQDFSPRAHLLWLTCRAYLPALASRGMSVKQGIVDIVAYLFIVSVFVISYYHVHRHLRFHCD